MTIRMIVGRVIGLPDDRTVSVGRVADKPTLYVRFTNKEFTTKIKISPEAFQAMIDLRDEKIGVTQSEILPTTEAEMRWHVVQDSTA